MFLATGARVNPNTDMIGGYALHPLYVLVAPLIVLAAKVGGLYDKDELVIDHSTLNELPRLVNLAAMGALLFWIARHYLVVGAPSYQIGALFPALASRFPSQAGDTAEARQAVPVEIRDLRALEPEGWSGATACSGSCRQSSRNTGASASSASCGPRRSRATTSCCGRSPSATTSTGS